MESHIPNDKYEITCSCGKTATVYFSEALDKYVASNSSWTYTKTQGCSRAVKGGWNCGEPDHYQKELQLI